MPIVVYDRILRHTLQSNMETLPADIRAIVAVWAPRATILPVRLNGPADPIIRLRAASEVFPPAEELECSFALDRPEPVEGAEARLPTFEDFAFRTGPTHKRSFAYSEHIVLCTSLARRIPADSEDFKNWTHGADLAATGIPIEVFQAFWALDYERSRPFVLQDRFLEVEWELPYEVREMQRDYVEEGIARVSPLKPLWLTLRTYMRSRIHDFFKEGAA